MAALGAIVILAGWAVIRAAGHRPGRAAAPAAQGLARAGLPLAVGILVLLGRSSLDGRPNTGEAGATGLARAGIQATGRRAATVVSVGSPKAAEQIALIDLEAGTVAESGAVAGGTGASWSVEALLPRYPEIGPGDRILVSGTVAPPGDDDYGAYLRQIGAAGTLRSPTLERLAGPAGPAGILDGIREGSADALARALPEPQAGLASGILVGLRDRVDRDLAAAFTQAGVSHIVAISGWNIAIVAALDRGAPARSRTPAADRGEPGRDRRLHPRRGRLAVGRSSRAHGRDRLDGPSHRPLRFGPGRARLGGRWSCCCSSRRPCSIPASSCPAWPPRG